MTPWTVACQAPRSLVFPRQEYWSVFPFPSPRSLPDPGTKPVSPALAGKFFTTEPPGKPLCPHSFAFSGISHKWSYIVLLEPNPSWPPKMAVLRVRTIRTCMCHEGGTFVNEISDLMEEIPQGSLAPLPRLGHSKKWQVCTPEEGLHSPTRLTPDLGLPSPRTMRNKFRVELVSQYWWGISISHC